MTPVFLCKSDQALELERDYLWKRSNGWTMNGRDDCWLVYVTPVGYKAVGMAEQRQDAFVILSVAV